MERLPLDRIRWPLAALLACVLTLGTAYFFEYVLNQAPCQMCWWQRYVYFAAIPVAGLAIAVNWIGARAPVMTALSILIGLIFLVGVFIATWHALYEWNLAPGPQGCEALGAGQIPTDVDLSTILSTPQRIPSCKEALWRVPAVPWGLSMAGLNAVWSLILAALSLFAATRGPIRADTANEPVQP
jgi:disulfide bond formation protein DsbB